MSRPTPERPVDLSLRRIRQAHAALEAVRALDSDLLTTEDDSALLVAQVALESLRLDLLEGNVR